MAGSRRVVLVGDKAFSCTEKVFANVLGALAAGQPAVLNGELDGCKELGTLIDLSKVDADGARAALVKMAAGEG